ncbi:hypothetical protein SZN_21296 [Streptomyces zinciresistens K42]|uniref:DUF2933 domain-containing protein n=1 Tax=Streptomyces zinciresistens K42 TaxID=700597 RepID=G2GFH5_9ACTN|nr:DUF2933 domain-containing protein [Streptomyces zinciresistens]EGX57727.1 hypothetical protein SZN_21296 [Streptomyces zinciresistens K42]
MCLNKKVLIGLGVVAVGLLLLKPAWMVAALPLLILAICPLSMILMMRGKKDGQGSSCSTGTQKTGAATTSETDKEINALQAELRSLKAAQAAQAEQEAAAAERFKKHL